MRQIFTESAAPSFEFVDTNGQAIEIKTTWISLAASTPNQQVIAAVAGKRLRVLSAFTHAASTSSVLLKNGNAGAGLIDLLSIATAENILPLNKIGWADTSVGVGLFADTGGAVTVISIRYIEFTQSA